MKTNKANITTNARVVRLHVDQTRLLTLIFLRSLDNNQFITTYIAGEAATKSKCTVGNTLSIEVEMIETGVGRLVRFGILKADMTDVAPFSSDRHYSGPIWHVNYMPSRRTAIACFRAF